MAAKAKVNTRVTKTRRRAYTSMRAKGIGKTKAGKIANAGMTSAGRSAMSRKAAATRARRAKR